MDRKTEADNTIRVGKWVIIGFAALEFVALVWLVVWLSRR